MRKVIKYIEENNGFLLTAFRQSNGDYLCEVLWFDSRGREWVLIKKL